MPDDSALMNDVITQIVQDIGEMVRKGRDIVSAVEILQGTKYYYVPYHLRGKVEIIFGTIELTRELKVGWRFNKYHNVK